MAIALSLAGCATPQSRPYLVPITAAKDEMAGWTEQKVRACFGEPRDSDIIAGLRRDRFQRGACTELVMFKDGMVHSVEGYGDVQSCWWVVDACEDPASPHPAAPVARAETWRAWTMAEVMACFGDPENVRSSRPGAFRVERDGCRIDMELDASRRLDMYEWHETEKGACRRLLRKCDGILQTMQQ